MNYRFGGAQRTISFGRYPELTLAEARESLLEARKLLGKGIDPVDHAKLERIADTMAAASSFKAVADEWLEKARPEQRAAMTIKKYEWQPGAEDRADEEILYGWQRAGYLQSGLSLPEQHITHTHPGQFSVQLNNLNSDQSQTDRISLSVDKRGELAGGSEHQQFALDTGRSARQQPIPALGFAPVPEPVVAGGRGAIALGNFCPERAGSEPSENAVEHSPVFIPGTRRASCRAIRTR
ncbi:hypothetical protein E4T56_gene7835 [Termitomyces sp. T112]|nr:hypothetical protein E4T56_gene7835 [Termitomyces sp. T112]